MDGELIIFSANPLYAYPASLVNRCSYELSGLWRPRPANLLEVLEAKQGFGELSPLPPDRKPGRHNPHYPDTGFDAASYYADVRNMERSLAILKPWVDQGGKILKSEEITFKGHKSMYAEIIASSLPTKVYGVDAGDYIYVIVLTRRRYSKIADAGLERDGTGILNSISFGQ